MLGCSVVLIHLREHLLFVDAEATSHVPVWGGCRGAWACRVSPGMSNHDAFHAPTHSLTINNGRWGSIDRRSPGRSDTGTVPSPVGSTTRAASCKFLITSLTSAMCCCRRMSSVLVEAVGTRVSSKARPATSHAGHAPAGQLVCVHEEAVNVDRAWLRTVIHHRVLPTATRAHVREITTRHVQHKPNHSTEQHSPAQHAPQSPATDAAACEGRRS